MLASLSQRYMRIFAETEITASFNESIAEFKRNLRKNFVKLIKSKK